MSNSSGGYVPSDAVDPPALTLKGPPGAGRIVNSPAASVTTGGATCSGIPGPECVRNNRIVTPAIGALLLLRTTPVILVNAGFPGTRAVARNAAAFPALPTNVASMTLLSCPS